MRSAEAKSFHFFRRSDSSSHSALGIDDRLVVGERDVRVSTWASESTTPLRRVNVGHVRLGPSAWSGARARPPTRNRVFRESLHFIGRRFFGQQVAALGHQRVEAVHQLLYFFLLAVERLRDPNPFFGGGPGLLEFDVALFLFRRPAVGFARPTRAGCGAGTASRSPVRSPAAPGRARFSIPFRHLPDWTPSGCGRPSIPFRRRICHGGHEAVLGLGLFQERGVLLAGAGGTSLPGRIVFAGPAADATLQVATARRLATAARPVRQRIRVVMIDLAKRNGAESSRYAPVVFDLFQSSGSEPIRSVPNAAGLALMPRRLARLDVRVGLDDDVVPAPAKCQQERQQHQRANPASGQCGHLAGAWTARRRRTIHRTRGPALLGDCSSWRRFDGEPPGPQRLGPGYNPWGPATAAPRLPRPITRRSGPGRICIVYDARKCTSIPRSTSCILFCNCEIGRLFVFPRAVRAGINPHSVRTC